MGSGYKKTQCILGMGNIFDKYCISVFCWNFNASGEGGILTTDGHNMAVKDQRKMSTKGKYVPVCTTTEMEVQAQCYNRVIVRSYPVDLAFD